MTLQIEDYAMIGDCKTAALVGRDGSIDWLCWPRFDSAACFAALLGTPDNGRWLIAPKHPPLGIRRQYRPGTLVLETEFQTETGCAAIVDFMPPADSADLVRIVIGRSGRVDFDTELVVRFNYSMVRRISVPDDHPCWRENTPHTARHGPPAAICAWSRACHSARYRAHTPDHTSAC